jgi:hypothetical protein
MTIRVPIVRFLRGIAALSVALFAACVTPVTHPAPVPEPAPCVDSSYVQLRQQHPDSLSARAWQRPQTLDRQCVDARVQASREASAMMGIWHSGSRLMGVGIATVVMVAMMISMW